MAYNGYLIKVGNFIIPHKYIKADTYKVTRLIQDLDSFRDANGLLHRQALEHVPNKIEFETPPLMTNSDVGFLFSQISANYIVPSERKVSAEFYVPEKDIYVTQDMYIPDPTFQIYGIFHGVIKYEPIRIAFIGY